MNRKLIIGCVSLAMLGFLNGCSTPDVPFVNTDNTNECMQIDNKLVRVDQFIKTISTMDASQASEYILAMPAYEITNSSEKSRMLKDAHKRKSTLLAQQQKLGCNVTTKK